jgi:hypothetical protein
VISLLSKVLHFWRQRGSAALFRLVLFKFSRPDVEIYSLVADSDDRFGTRKGIRAQQVADLRFSKCSPLRVFSVPSAGPSRISIVTNSINSEHLYGGVGTAMIFAALLAEEKQARLRIVTRTERAKKDNLEHILEIYGIRLTLEVEFAFAPFYDRQYEMDVFDDEIFVTTSWWTTAAAMASVPDASIIYLLQEDERMFYPYGDERLRCEQVLSSRSIRFVLNTRLLFEHLLSAGLPNIAEHGIWFEPAFPRDVFYPRSVPGTGKRRLMFYARPNNLRNLFYFGIELIEEAIVRGVIDLDEWEILLVGKDIPNVVFSDGYAPSRIEGLPWAKYAELAGTIDLGLCLMCTPHPSYPPLDLAASGAVVVTNRFENKIDLSNYSANILCGDLDQESMVAALAKGIRLAKTPDERIGNHRANAMQSDWRSAFAEVIRRIGEKA